MAAVDEGAGDQGLLLLTAYPNVGGLHGEVEVALCVEEGLRGAREAVARAVFGGVEAASVRLFSASGGGEVTTWAELQHEVARGGVVASAGSLPFREAVREPPAETVASRAKRRYDDALVGGQVPRVDAADPELPALLRCSVPLVVTGSGLTGAAPERWTFDYLERHLRDVDNFFVLCARPASRGRFPYYDMGEGKNPCNYEVNPIQRVEMRFPDFRRKAMESLRCKRAGKPSEAFYLQNTLLHRDESEEGPPRPVGSFGSACGKQVGADIANFRWSWLKEMMGGRNAQMCQLFCGVVGGFSPCHYDPQDNLFAQVRGYKRVLLFHPRHWPRLYPWPVHHPQDRQSRVNFEDPDLASFPRFSELRGCGLEAVLGPGEALRIPPCWWHHIEMLPSPPDGEVVSINFWYPPPPWFYGDPKAGQMTWDKPLFGAKRVLFQRCIEDFIAQSASPAEIPEVLSMCGGRSQLPPPGGRLLEVVHSARDFVATVFPDPADQRTVWAEVLEGRFLGLVPRAG